MSINKKKIILYGLIISLAFLFDRFSKFYILQISDGMEFFQQYINDYFNILLVYNTGIGFGLFSFSDTIYYNIITSLIILINFVIFYLAYISESIKGGLYSLILGGSLGNLFDRILYKAVPDFIDFHIGNYHWFIFNIADIFITLGVIFMIFSEFFSTTNKNE